MAENVYLCRVNALYMRDFTVHIEVPAYLHDYLVNKYGNPLRFPARSPQNDLLHYLVAVARPKRKEEPKRSPMKCRSIAVVLPCRTRHKPEHYHHLSQEAEKIFTRDLRRFFRLDLKACVLEAVESGESVPRAIDRWCERHGIGIVHRDAVRKIYYRMREELRELGVNLPRRNKNRCCDKPVFGFTITTFGGNARE